MFEPQTDDMMVIGIRLWLVSSVYQAKYLFMTSRSISR
jgi:hypothetical protein